MVKRLTCIQRSPLKQGKMVGLVGIRKMTAYTRSIGPHFHLRSVAIHILLLLLFYYFSVLIFLWMFNKIHDSLHPKTLLFHSCTYFILFSTKTKAKFIFCCQFLPVILSSIHLLCANYSQLNFPLKDRKVIKKKILPNTQNYLFIIKNKTS